MTESENNKSPVVAENDAVPVAPSTSDTPQLPVDDMPVVEPGLGVAPEQGTDLEAPEPEPAEEPETDAVPQAPEAALVEGVRGGLIWLPFALYLGLWVTLAGLSAYFLHGATLDEPARWLPEYEPLLWAGVSLTALGPVLSLAVWLVSRARRPKGERRGLFASAMTRGALVTFFGVLLWLGTLFVLELLATGWTL